MHFYCRFTSIQKLKKTTYRTDKDFANCLMVSFRVISCCYTLAGLLLGWGVQYLPQMRVYK
jgi:hypothetical protein